VHIITFPGAEPRYLLRAIIQQKTALLRVERRCAAGGRARAEDSDGAMRAPVGRSFIGRTAHAHRYPGPDIVAKSDRAQKTGSADSNCSPAASAADTIETPGWERDGPCESSVSSA